MDNLQAFIKETLRHDSTVYALIPRRTTKAIKIGDFVVDKGVNVYVP